MTMAMDEEELLQEEEDFWCLQLQRGERITLIPYDDEPFVVTDVFLVDPESVAGQGVVSACVQMGTRNVMLAQLSSDVTDVELETPLVLDEEFSFYVMRPDTHSDADTDEDAIFVQFEGYVLSSDTDYEESEEDEEVASSEDGDDGVEEESEEDEESDGEVDGDVATASSANE